MLVLGWGPRAQNPQAGLVPSSAISGGSIEFSVPQNSPLTPYLRFETNLPGNGKGKQ
jgi:hypothetical protein